MKMMITAAGVVGKNSKGSTYGIDEMIDSLTYGTEFDQMSMINAYMAQKFGPTVGIEAGDYKVMTKEELAADTTKRKQQRG